MATFFTGLGDRYNQANTGAGAGKPQAQAVIIGTVLEICYGSSTGTATNKYTDPKDIGKIRFRNVEMDRNKKDSECLNYAYPIDRTLTKYPLPGEQVLIHLLYAESDGSDDQKQRPPIVITAFYSSVASTLMNPTYNSYPYIGSGNTVAADLNKVSLAQADRRLENNIKNIDSFKEGDDVRIYKQLQPSEGDVVLQGRFGNTIRLSSTTPVGSNPWSKAGAGGSGLIIIRVDRDATTTQSESSTLEDINVDDASIYMCTSQKIEMKLSCAKELKSWRARYGIPNTNGSGGTSVSTLQRDKDQTKSWQKL